MFLYMFPDHGNKRSEKIGCNHKVPEKNEVGREKRRGRL
uniref:Uncharacterized protein n=1 Tax=Anguilla anguilla TaxID=7936 RepID=A0A0E9PDI1_ANGAN